MGKMKLETETNGLRHGFWGTMVPHGAQSNFGGRSKEAYPPKPMPSFASGDISARRSSWLSISIYLQNFDMYIFIRINEMCIYIYIHMWVFTRFELWFSSHEICITHHSFPAILLRSWTSRTGKLWDPCSTRRAISPNFEEPEGWLKMICFHSDGELGAGWWTGIYWN
jgi:hypothetical protein